MNRKIMEALGFKEDMALVDAGKCPVCKQPITGFRNEDSEKEFRVSGMCQDCQDKTFGTD
jgi:hypothetical protein